MYTGFSSGFKRNQMLTPTSIAMTQSLIDNAVKNITISGDVSGDMFSINANNEIEPIDDLTIRTSEMKVTTVDDTDDDSVANIGYLNSTYETISNHNADKLTLLQLIDDKASASSVYSKAEMDTALAAKANAADVYTKTETDNKYIQSAEYGAQSISNTLNVRYQVLTPIVEDKRFQGFVVMGGYLVLNGEKETQFTPTVPQFQLDKGVQYTFTATIETESENIKISNLPYVRMGGDWLDITQGSISGNSYIATATPSSNIFPSYFYFGIRNGHIDTSVDTSAVVELTITHVGDPEYQNSSLKNYIQSESASVCVEKADVIKTTDSTSAEDSNVYSAAKADELFEPKSSLQANYYDKTAVDGIRTAIVAAADNKYVTKTNPGTLNGNLTVNGEIYTSSVTTTGDINLTQGAVLDASGDGQFGGNLTVDGQTTLNDDLEVNGNITVSSNAQFDDTVIIEGTTTINNDCNVNGCITLDGDLNIANSGALDVTGSSTFHYDVTCNDILTVDSTLYTNDFVSTGIVEFRTTDIIIGTNGNTITVNKAFFDSILSRLHALDGQ